MVTDLRAFPSAGGGYRRKKRKEIGRDDLVLLVGDFGLRYYAGHLLRTRRCDRR